MSSREILACTTRLWTSLFVIASFRNQLESSKELGMWQRRNCAMQITMGGWIMNIAWLIFAVWAWLAFEDPLQVQKKRCAHPLPRHRQCVKTLSCVHGR